MIIEGIHILPYVMQVLKKKSTEVYHIPIGVSVFDEKKHKRRFLNRGTINNRKLSNFYINHFDEIRQIQKYCMSVCENLEIEIINNDNFNSSLITITNIVLEKLYQQIKLKM